MKGRRKPLALSAAGRFVIDVLAGRPVRVPDDVSVDFWSEASDICFRHGVHRIVAHRLTAAGEAVPADARRELVIELEQDRPRGNACLMATVRQLVETGQALDSAGIPFMPMKGIVLVHTIYGNEPLLRVFGDIDILVPEDRYDETISCLTEHSYTLAPHKRDTAALRNYSHTGCVGILARSRHMPDRGNNLPCPAKGMLPALPARASLRAAPACIAGLVV